jgi:hypothetical protein
MKKRRGILHTGFKLMEETFSEHLLKVPGPALIDLSAEMRKLCFTM